MGRGNTRSAASTTAKALAVAEEKGERLLGRKRGKIWSCEEISCVSFLTPLCVLGNEALHILC